MFRVILGVGWLKLHKICKRLIFYDLSAAIRFFFYSFSLFTLFSVATNAPLSYEVGPHVHHPLAHVAVLVVVELTRHQLGLVQDRLVHERHAEHVGNGLREADA